MLVLGLIFVSCKDLTKDDLPELNPKSTQYYIDRLADKYNLDIEKMKLIEVVKEHYEKRPVGIWFDYKLVVIPDFIKFNYNGKIITVFGDYDDFYYDELIEGVKNYYREILNIDELYVDIGATLGHDYYCVTEYASYFMQTSIQTVDNSVIEDLLSRSTDITLILKVNNNDIEGNVKKLIDNLNLLPKKVSVQVMSDISMIKDYRQKPNYYYFDYYYISIIDYDYRYTRISKSEMVNYLYYNNYYYSPIDNAKN